MGKHCRAGAGHRRQYGTCALHAGYLRLQIHTLRLCNTHCFSSATMVARTRLNVTLYVYRFPVLCTENYVSVNLPYLLHILVLAFVFGLLLARNLLISAYLHILTHSMPSTFYGT